MRYTPKILDGRAPWYAPTIDMLRKLGMREMEAEAYYLTEYENMNANGVAGRFRVKKQTTANHLSRARRVIAHSTYRKKSCQNCVHREECASAGVGTELKADTCAHYEKEKKS